MNAMQRFRRVLRAEMYLNNFHMICKSTASALENAVNKVKVVYLAMLAKTGSLFTKRFFCALV